MHSFSMSSYLLLLILNYHLFLLSHLIVCHINVAHKERPLRVQSYVKNSHWAEIIDAPVLTSLRFLVGNSFIVRCYVSFGEHALEGKKNRCSLHAHVFFYVSFLSFRIRKAVQFWLWGWRTVGTWRLWGEKSFCLIQLYIAKDIKDNNQNNGDQTSKLTVV